MRASLILSAALLASCAAPGPLAPGAASSLEIPARFDATRAPVPQISNTLLGLFDDPRLRSTVNQALSNNPDLKGSLARMEEAGFNTRKTASELYPSLDGNARAGRSSVPVLGESSDFRLSLDARWELDVWGRIRAGVQASSADQAAATADYESARQSLAAQTMQAWFDLVSAEKRLALGNRRITSFEDTYKLVSRRFELGTSRLGDLELARTDLENGRADLRQLEDDRDRAARAVRLLTGAYPDSKLSASSWTSLSRAVATGIPSDVLKKRPDSESFPGREPADSNARRPQAKVCDRCKLIIHTAPFARYNDRPRQGPVRDRQQHTGTNHTHLYRTSTGHRYDLSE